jgi:hypothetical protein
MFYFLPNDLSFFPNHDQNGGKKKERKRTYSDRLTSVHRYKETFVPRHFNALATLALYTRPGTIRIFHSLEPMVKCIMFGRVTDDLRSDISRLPASEALAIAAHEGSQALRRQEAANSWIVVNDAESSGKERMAELLAQLPPA